jgi:hypothetical protein
VFALEQGVVILIFALLQEPVIFVVKNTLNVLVVHVVVQVYILLMAVLVVALEVPME